MLGLAIGSVAVIAGLGIMGSLAARNRRADRDGEEYVYKSFDTKVKRWPAAIGAPFFAPPIVTNRY